MISKTDLLKLFTKEHATTIKVLKAYPEGQETLKPSEDSRNAMDIAKTFVFEMYLLEGYFFGDQMDPSKFQTYNPESFAVVVKDFEELSTRILSRLEALAEEDMKKTVDFAGLTFPLDEFGMMMLHDQIHHRGQLSIYVRLAGGKIPSIYGPSRDDQSTNL